MDGRAVLWQLRLRSPRRQKRKHRTVTVKYDGILIGVGGHMHDYAKQITLEDTTRKETVATLNANLDEKGQLLSMPVVTFLDRGGYKFAAGDELRITATYDNPTGKPLSGGAMGIVVGYFLPADDNAMSALRRNPKPATRQETPVVKTMAAIRDF